MSAPKQKTEESLSRFLKMLRTNDFTSFAKTVHRTMDQTIKTETAKVVSKK